MYNDGSEPDGPILNSQVKDMINRGINASAGMLIVNPNARNTAKIGIGNEFFKKGSIQYVGSEIRAVILNKMMVDTQDDVCVIEGRVLPLRPLFWLRKERLLLLNIVLQTVIQWRKM